MWRWVIAVWGLFGWYTARMEMEKDFDGWNVVKQRRHGIVAPPQFREGQVWRVAVGINIGDELNGKHTTFERPVLVLRKFNKMVFLGVPLTTKPTQVIARYPKYYFDLGDRDGLRSCLSLTQLRLFSANRLLQRATSLNSEKLHSIRKAVSAIL